MHTYERITYKSNDARAMTIILRDPTLVGGMLTGIQVNTEGDEIASRGFDERRHVIDATLVTSRVPMVWDLHYGALSAATTTI